MDIAFQRMKPRKYDSFKFILKQSGIKFVGYNGNANMKFSLERLPSSFPK